MSKDIYFSILIQRRDGEPQGFTVHFSVDSETLPGERIRQLTAAARTLALPEGERLRTEILVAPESRIDTRPLDDYSWGDGSINSARLVRHLKSYREGRRPHQFLPRTGMTVVLDEEFIGRHGLLARLEALVVGGRSCHLRAPRRYGKTSLMGRLAARQARAIMMDLADVGSELGFLKALLRAGMRNGQAADCLVRLPPYARWPATRDAVEFLGAFNQAFEEMTSGWNPRRISDGLFETLAHLADCGVRLLADEFSVFLREMFETDAEALKVFLKRFKDLRTRRASPLQTVFAGSAGLSTYIELYDLKNYFDDLTPIDVDPIGADDARELAEELFYGMNKQPTPSAIERLVALTGGDETVPYFVHALAAYTAEQVKQTRRIDPEDVESAYFDRLLGPAGNVCFRDFILRERTYPGPYRKSASSLLKALSRVAPGTMAKVELEALCVEGCELGKIMTCLEEDYDLVRDGDGWRMRSRVIADRWRLGEPWLTLGAH